MARRLIQRKMYIVDGYLSTVKAAKGREQ